GLVPDLADRHQLLQAGRRRDEVLVDRARKDRLEEAPHRDDETEVFLESPLSVDRQIRNPFELRGRTKLAALRLESRLQPARAFELDDEDAAAAPRRSEGERERDGRPPDATLPDGEQQAAPEQVVGLHASRTGDSSAGASSLRR